MWPYQFLLAPPPSPMHADLHIRHSALHAMCMWHLRRMVIREAGHTAVPGIA
jgi:hypothetical protein